MILNRLTQILKAENSASLNFFDILFLRKLIQNILKLNSSNYSYYMNIISVMFNFQRKIEACLEGIQETLGISFISHLRVSNES